MLLWCFLTMDNNSEVAEAMVTLQGWVLACLDREAARQLEQKNPGALFDPFAWSEGTLISQWEASSNVWQTRTGNGSGTGGETTAGLSFVKSVGQAPGRSQMKGESLPLLVGRDLRLALHPQKADVKVSKVISVEITGVKNMNKNRRNIILIQASGMCCALWVDERQGNNWTGKAEVFFEGVAGGGSGNGEIGWFVVGGRMMCLAFLRLKNSRCLMCPV
jgi:hypothetical protein